MPDPMYPNWGVNLEYLGGSQQYCDYYDEDYNLHTTQRSFNIAFVCDCKYGALA